MNREQTLPTAREFRRAKEYFETHIEHASNPNFDFSHGGQALSGPAAVTELESDARRRTIEKRWTAGGVEVRQVATLYRDLPVVEWTVYVKNISDTASQRVRLSALNDRFAASTVVVHAQKGSYCAADDFRPIDLFMRPGDRADLSPIGGRSSNMTWPYFCIETGTDGLDLAVGWPAQWKAVFACADDSLHIQCGQQTLDTTLYGRDSGVAGMDRTGEQIRSPRIVLLFWDRGGLRALDACIRARNLFRRYMLSYNMPRGKDGNPPVKNLAACSSHQFREMLEANTENQKQFIDGYVDHALGLDYWWMDAGWYPCDGDWYHTGTWKYDKRRFPNGIREISDYGRSRGVGTILWHEPERVYEGSEIYENHKDWLFFPISENPKGYHCNSKCALFNLGDESACAWMTDLINRSIDENGVDFYRQDFNTDPLAYIENHETEGRRGANENHYASGLLRFWDGLQEKHPGMLMDACASGGRRNDVDVMKRMVPLIRSDRLFVPDEQQAQFVGFSQWIPFNGTGLLFGDSNIMIEGVTWKKEEMRYDLDLYMIRSMYSPHMTCCLDVRKTDFPWDDLRAILDEWRAIVPYYQGDLYPFTEFSLADDCWAAWQFDRPDLSGGVVQAFRRAQDKTPSRTFRLHGLEKSLCYAVYNFDTKRKVSRSGAELMEQGISVTLPARGSTVITYKRV